MILGPVRAVVMLECDYCPDISRNFLGVRFVRMMGGLTGYHQWPLRYLVDFRAGGVSRLDAGWSQPQ